MFESGDLATITMKNTTIWRCDYSTYNDDGSAALGQLTCGDFVVVLDESTNNELFVLTKLGTGFILIEQLRPSE